MVYRKIIHEPDPACRSCGHLGSKHDPDPHGGVDSCLACPGGRCQPARVIPHPDDPDKAGDEE